MRNDTRRDDAGPTRKRTQVQVQKDYEGVQMKSSREQFEEWVANTTSSDLHRSIMLDKRENGSYRHLATNNKWESWQASRAAIEIELPDKVMVEDEFDNGLNCAIDYCADAIRAAGLTVKGES